MPNLLPPENYSLPLPFYNSLIPPLSTDIECHALLTFAIKASRMLIEYNKPQLESEESYTPEYKNLYLNTCKLYNVDPDKVWNYWKLVDKVFKNIDTSLPYKIRSLFIPKPLIII